MSRVTHFKGIDIVVRTRDEHCDPHVHAYHIAQGWEIRVFFSFVGDRITAVQPLAGKMPKQATIQHIMNLVIDHLDEARALFWQAVNSTCLERKHIMVDKGVAYHAAPGSLGAVQIHTARYLPDKQSIEYRLSARSAFLTAQCP